MGQAHRVINRKTGKVYTVSTIKKHINNFPVEEWGLKVDVRFQSAVYEGEMRNRKLICYVNYCGDTNIELYNFHLSVAALVKNASGSIVDYIVDYISERHPYGAISKEMRAIFARKTQILTLYPIELQDADTPANTISLLNEKRSDNKIREVHEQVAEAAKIFAKATGDSKLSKNTESLMLGAAANRMAYDGDYLNAERFLLESLKLYPIDPMTRSVLAKVYRVQNLHQHAINALGQKDLIRPEKFTKADNEFTDKLLKNVDEAMVSVRLDYFTEYGLNYIGLGRYEYAIDALDFALTTVTQEAIDKEQEETKQAIEYGLDIRATDFDVEGQLNAIRELIAHYKPVTVSK